MKYLRLFESFEDIDKICREYGITKYAINPDGSINVNNFIWISNCNLTKLPIKFSKSLGFYCENNKLKTLEGSPVEVNGNFFCGDNKLTSFEFAPKIIRGTLDCCNNNIKTFEHFPNFIKNHFFCDNNLIFDVWSLFYDDSKIELLNDFDIFRDEDKDISSIFIDRLNDFLEM